MSTIIVSRSGKRSEFDPDKITPMILKMAEEAELKLTPKELEDIRSRIAKKVRYLFQKSMPSSKIEQIAAQVFSDMRSPLTNRRLAQRAFPQ